jgi:hypothetical protein
MKIIKLKFIRLDPKTFGLGVRLYGFNSISIYTPIQILIKAKDKPQLKFTYKYAKYCTTCMLIRLVRYARNNCITNGE